MEGVECVCTGRGRICVYGRVYCVFMGRGRMCVYKRDGVCMDGEGEGVYMEWVKRVVTGRGYVYME